jgi:glycosyltransferase involved in cell wall biosynthesis
VDVLRLTGKPESEISTIYLGLDPVFETDLRGSRNKKGAGAVQRAAIDKEILFGSISGKFACTFKNPPSRELLAPYLLHVGSDTWYKNRRGVLRIYREVRRRLGRAAPNLIMVGSALEPKVPGVHYLEVVTDTMLADLYRNAALLLFPSLYEGFGWPVVEANACGCPAVVSGIAPLVEAGGSAAALISDPRDINEAADRVIEVLDNNTLLDRREAAYLNACRFPSCEMIGQYLELYATAAGE